MEPTTFTFSTMFLAGFMMQLQWVWIVVLLWRLIVWLDVMFITWNYFRREVHEGSAGVESEDELQKVYRDALSSTKAHMQTMRPWIPRFLR